MRGLRWFYFLLCFLIAPLLSRVQHQTRAQVIRLAFFEREREKQGGGEEGREGDFNTYTGEMMYHIYFIFGTSLICCTPPLPFYINGCLKSGSYALILTFLMGRDQKSINERIVIPNWGMQLYLYLPLLLHCSPVDVHNPVVPSER